MSSKDDKTPKTAADLYTKVMGEDEKPDYAKFIIYANKNQDEALLMSILRQEKAFDSKDKVIGLLESHLAKQEAQGIAATKAEKWADRVISNTTPVSSKKR